jgi:hypothetical protein
MPFHKLLYLRRNFAENAVDALAVSNELRAVGWSSW